MSIIRIIIKLFQYILGILRRNNQILYKKDKVIIKILVGRLLVNTVNISLIISLINIFHFYLM